jgi:hypothetical protein
MNHDAPGSLGLGSRTLHPGPKTPQVPGGDPFPGPWIVAHKKGFQGKKLKLEFLSVLQG